MRSWSDSEQDKPPRMKTSVGILHGEQLRDAFVFRGVPYARAPIGDLRWRPPELVTSASVIRDSTAFGPACWQRDYDRTSIYTRGDLEMSEDCLYLNIWTKALDNLKQLPVMVWLHGGGHARGSSSAPVYDGTALAKKGVVVVTIN